MASLAEQLLEHGIRPRSYRERLDNLDRRLARVERRLDLVDESAS